MKIYSNPPRKQWLRICQRPEVSVRDLEPIIKEVFDAVASQGDRALKTYTSRFDGVSLPSVLMGEAEVKKLASKTPPALKKAIDQAYDNIRKFHEAQAIREPAVETSPGVWCWREARPIERVGLYVPGGSAPLVSTVLMLTVPARLAGCPSVTLCTPPRTDGTVDPAICYAALKTGVTRIVRVGGIQAIAALAEGTATVERVDKIFGPGNQYVTAAKQYVSAAGKTAIDMLAGPSEVLVVADKLANPAFAAADMLSQAEHGPDSQTVLLTDSHEQAEAIQAEIDVQLKVLPRKDVAVEALKNSFCVVLDSIETAIAFSNVYAPEHLILSVREAESLVAQVQNAGSVFLGDYSPESAGDYASGTNHTLPTNGWARNHGGVSLDSFVKKVTFQSLTKTGLTDLAPTIEALAQAEGLLAHARAVSIRVER